MSINNLLKSVDAPQSAIQCKSVNTKFIVAESSIDTESLNALDVVCNNVQTDVLNAKSFGTKELTNININQPGVPTAIVTSSTGYLEIDVNVAFNAGQKFTYTFQKAGITPDNNCIVWLGAPASSPAVSEEMCEKVSVACAGIDPLGLFQISICNHSTALYNQPKVYISYLIM
jgi:hypothetical protein